MTRHVPDIDAKHFRKVLGCYPTGVSVVTSSSENMRFGLAIGSFTSISLDPPLVGFFPALSSSSWPKIQETGRFCVNVLGAQQLLVCQRFAMSHATDKFEGMAHGHSPAGLPIIDGAVAWIECDIDHVQTVGDHLLVVGRVSALDTGDETNPLIFFKGRYHELAELSDLSEGGED